MLNILLSTRNANNDIALGEALPVFVRRPNHGKNLPKSLTAGREPPVGLSYKLLTCDIKNLEYVMLLSEDQTAVYLAKVDGREVLVRFVALALTYNTRARRLLAGDCLAPKLIYDGTKRPCYGGLLMVVMDYVHPRGIWLPLSRW